ncbi:MAG: TylF/MycF/NovP-related O-methyltransferase [Vicinamibacteria bacterium]
MWYPEPMHRFKPAILAVLRPLLRPVASNLDLDRWGYWLGRIYEVKLPGKVVPNPEPSAAGSANINIVLKLAERSLALPGNMAECGVFRGSTLSTLAFFLKKWNSSKTIFGFDSFEGFDDSVRTDRQEGDTAYIDKESTLFTATSEQLVRDKIDLVRGTENLQLVKGFFDQTLTRFPSERFCFVHLDCDLYEAYKTCLAFFYPRLEQGGIILFDEYNDAVYKGCNKAVDEYLADKPEKPVAIQQDNYIKYFIVKQ